MWDPEHSQQLGNIFGINVLLLVSHPSSGYEIWFYHDSAPPSHCDFFSVFGCGISFFFFFGGGGGSGILLSIIVQQLVAIFVLSQEEMSMCPSALPPWTRVSLFCSFYFWETVQSMNIPQFVNSFPYWLAFDCFQFRTLHVKLLSTFAKKIWHYVSPSRFLFYFTDLFICPIPRISLMAQLVKNPPTMRETWVRSLGWEDPLGKGMATHSSILAWRIPWTV